MFSGCSSIETIDISGFDTSNVETMKAMFWNRYYHWGGVLDPQSTNFKEWYKTYYQRRETNLQRRTKQRMVELTAKCRFYKGEKENPLANTEDELMWYYESVWLDRRLSLRYSEYLQINMR